jgi:hypothetical protein
MTLLEDIQHSAVDTSSDLATLLRKCKVLAARLGSQPLEDWVLWESNGYPENTNIPSYRIFPLSLKGNFSDPYGIRRLNAANIHIGAVPENIRQKYVRYECRQSIASIEPLINDPSDNTKIQIDLGSIAGYLGKNAYNDMVCLHAWAELPKGGLIELLNAVRNRILDFALAVWKAAPNAGEIGTKEGSKIPYSTVTQIFNTTIHGGAANILGTANHSQVSFQVSLFDFESLKKALLSNNVDESDIQELKNALDIDPKIESPDAFGPQVSSWIAKMIGKAASGVWNVGLGAAGNILAQIIGKYYGFPS